MPSDARHTPPRDPAATVDLPFRTPLVVRFGDVDPAGIVYYPRFPHFCHVAMEEFFHAVVGFDYPRLLNELRIGLPTVRLECDFRQPLRYGETAVIEVEASRAGSASIEWRHRFLRPGGEEVVAECRVVTVCVNMDSWRKQPVPAWLRERLAVPADLAGEG
ncbi:MAG: thioesterase family protein [Thermoanaerobaculia bacterium]